MYKYLCKKTNKIYNDYKYAYIIQTPILIVMNNDTHKYYV